MLERHNLYPNLERWYIDILPLWKYNDAMDNEMKLQLAQSIRDFRLPRYRELPDMGLYLEQTTKYLNQCLGTLGCGEVTGSMIRNYVKMGMVANPVKKQYYIDHIAHLISITLLKNVLSLEHIHALFLRQRKVYTDEVAYNYFCAELENLMRYQFGLQDQILEIGMSQSLEKEMLRSAITAVCHSIYLNACFRNLKREEASEKAGPDKPVS